jgi:hypothetical protein
VAIWQGAGDNSKKLWLPVVQIHLLFLHPHRQACTVPG